MVIRYTEKRVREVWGTVMTHRIDKVMEGGRKRENFIIYDEHHVKILE